MADKKLSELTTVTTVASGDKISFTSTPEGTPASKNITIDHLFGLMTGAAWLSTTNVALNANADTTIYTVPAGKRLVPAFAILVAGADASTTVISIGADGAETDWIPNNTLSNLDAANDAVILMPVPNTTPTKIKSYAAATVIQAKVSSQAGGPTNSLKLFGFLYDA